MLNTGSPGPEKAGQLCLVDGQVIHSTELPLKNIMSIKQLGPYKIQEVLGRGGMGTVFKAIDENTKNEVAVKVLSPAHADDDHFRSRFESEIITLKELDHPNIVRILGHGEDDGNLYFAMELVNGKSLHVHQKMGHRFYWQEVIGIAMDVCAGLHHAHLRGVFHRDIKPANLLKTDSGTTKITDFGIAKLYGAAGLTMHGGAIGTADYMSPEQAQGGIISERSDLFSLGCVMYALLCGRPPFAEKDVQSTIVSLTTKQPPPLRQRSPETPPEFERLIDRLLQKNPEDRFGTAHALNERLIDILQLMKQEADAQTAVAVDLDDGDEYQLLPTDQTVASSPMTAGIEVKTQAIPESERTDKNPPKSAPGQPTLVETEKKPSYYQPVERKKKSTLDVLEEQKDGPVWPYVAGIIVVLGLIVWGMTNAIFSQPSADQLYEQITSDELPNESDCDDFLTRFPEDERANRVESIKSEIDSRKLEKRLLLAKKVYGIRSMYPIEILLLHAVELRKDDPYQSYQQLESLINMYEGDDDLTNKEQTALSSAAFFRTRFKHQADAFVEKNTEDIERALDRANSLIEDDKFIAASVLLESIQKNFQGDAWANSFVETAKLQLNTIKADVEKEKSRSDETNE